MNEAPSLSFASASLRLPKVIAAEDQRRSSAIAFSVLPTNLESGSKSGHLIIRRNKLCLDLLLRNQSTTAKGREQHLDLIIVI